MSDHPMTQIHVPVAEPAEILRAAESLRPGDDDLLLIFIAEDEAPELDSLVETLCATQMNFMGGVFPAILVGQERLQKGALVLKMPCISPPMLIHDLSQSTPLLTSISEHLDAKPNPHPPTAIILVDGLAANISRLLGATYNELGSRVRFWGGGAGVSTFEQRPCLFTRDGVIENGAVIALTSLGVGLGVQHGWKVLKGPLVATRATGNTVHQLNWMAAVDVYSQHVADDLGHTLDVASLTSVTQSYPLGLHKEGEEVVVRDPVSVGSSGSLTCVGDVPENAVLAILKGDPKSLIHAAGQAARNACEGAPKEIVHCLIADCISRVMFLGDDFRSELEAIKHNLGDLPDGLEPVGVLTLGEISSRGDGYLEFFNKTCVVAVLHEQ